MMLTRRGDSLILRTPILSESQFPDEDSGEEAHPDSNLGYVAIRAGSAIGTPAAI